MILDSFLNNLHVDCFDLPTQIIVSSANYDTFFFQFLCLLFLYFALMHWLGSPKRWWTKVIVVILVFLISRKILQHFTIMYIVFSKFFVCTHSDSESFLLFLVFNFLMNCSWILSDDFSASTEMMTYFLLLIMWWNNWLMFEL